MSDVGLSSDFLGSFGLLERDGCILLARNRRRLRPGESPRLVHDLPGGRVEPGETLAETLVREWREECRLEVVCGRFLFVQEGTRVLEGRRCYAWRSFFFAVEATAEPRPGDVSGLLWIPRPRVAEVLGAPYHAAFVRWLEDGEAMQHDVWS